MDHKSGRTLTEEAIIIKNLFNHVNDVDNLLSLAKHIDRVGNQIPLMKGISARLFCTVLPYHDVVGLLTHLNIQAPELSHNITKYTALQMYCEYRDYKLLYAKSWDKPPVIDPYKKKKVIKCFNCGKKGHKKNKCRSEKRHNKESSDGPIIEAFSGYARAYNPDGTLFE